jgi:hypothetical protein
MRLFIVSLAGFSLAAQMLGGSLSSSDFSIDQVYEGAANPTTTADFAVNNNFGPGFVNVLSADGAQWLVQNLYVGLDTSYAQTFNAFNLNTTGAAQSTDNLIVDFSSTPKSTLAAVSADDSTVESGLTVSSLVENVQTETSTTGPEGALPGNGNTTLTFGGTGFGATYQLGHPNVEAAVNQCAPAAVANSLTWLGLNNVPNNPGSFGVADPPNADSLVANLDILMGREETGCTDSAGGDTDPCGVWPLDGKLLYLSDLGNPNVVVNVQDSNGAAGQTAGNGNGITPGQNYTNYGVTATNQGNPSFSFIQSELAAGEDVEFDIKYLCPASGQYTSNGQIVMCTPGDAIGRHYVEATGAGSVLGQDFITQISDLSQGMAGGTNMISLDEVVNGNQLPNEGPGGAVIDQVISESVVPEPGTVLLIGSGLLFLGGLKWRQRLRQRFSRS